MSALPIIIQKKKLLGSKLNYLISWAFWSKEDDGDYYASLEDGSVYYSLTEKE